MPEPFLGGVGVFAGEGVGHIDRAETSGQIALMGSVDGCQVLAQGKRYKTVESIVDEVDWQPLPDPEEVVGVRVIYGEYELSRRVKQAGGVWNREKRVWELRYQEVVVLGLEARVVREEEEMYEVVEA